MAQRLLTRRREEYERPFIDLHNENISNPMHAFSRVFLCTGCRTDEAA